MNIQLPGFLCVGAAKSGTTSLHEILSAHPDIYLPERKEIHFFENDENYSKGLKWYEQYFLAYKNEKITGEITADYMFYDYVPKRIATALGNQVKLIYMLRDPVDRAYSEYLFNVRRGFFKGSFLQAIEHEKKFDPTQFQNRYFTHIYRSMYAGHISNMFNEFNERANHHFIIFEEDFKKNKEATFTNLFQFLDVPYHALQFDQVYKPAYVPRFQSLQQLVFKPNRLRKFVRRLLPSYKFRRKIKDQLLPAINKSSVAVEKLDPVIKQELVKKYFYDDIQKTQDLIQRDLSIWLR